MDLRTAKRILRGDDLKPEAARVIEAKRARGKRVRVKSGPRVAAKAEKRAARNELTAEVRKGVFDRAERERGLRCEWYCERVACELHHVEQGAGRLKHQTIENCAAICTECHRAYHRHDLQTLAAAETWAINHGFRETARTIARRARKVERARAA